MFEQRTQPLLSRRRFALRLLRTGCFGALLLGFSLAMGMAGYHFLEHLPWLDAFLNAAMIMSGMGPVATLQTSAGKIFAGCYALYCGIALITAAAVMLSPVVHRIFHRFHLEEEPKD
jgi:hypothetical protein